MKTNTLLIGLLCGAALSTQAAQFDMSELNINVFGSYITPTTTAQLWQLEQDPWFNNSDLAKQYAQGYAYALFSYAKYNDSFLVENAPLVYFAYHSDGGDYLDTWSFDIGRNEFYNEEGNNIHMLLGLDPPPGGWQSVPDCASTAGLMLLALGGIAVGRKVVA